MGLLLKSKLAMKTRQFGRGQSVRQLLERRGEKSNLEKSRVTMLRFVGRTGRGESEAGKERLV